MSYVTTLKVVFWSILHIQGKGEGCKQLQQSLLGDLKATKKGKLCAFSECGGQRHRVQEHMDDLKKVRVLEGGSYGLLRGRIQSA